MKTFKGILILFAAIAGPVLSFICSVEAAKFAGGLRIDAWGFGAAYTMVFGGAAGLVVAIVVGIVLGCRKCTTFRAAFLSLLLIPPGVVSVLFASLTYFGATLPNKRSQAEYRAISDAVRNDPRALAGLITDARSGKLDKAGGNVLKNEILRSNQVKSEDMAFLVEHFMDDSYFVNSILFDRTKISEALFRCIYEHYKHKSTQTSQIISQIARSEQTPDDILEDIAEHNSRYPNISDYARSETVGAQETLLWKKIKGDPSVVTQLIADLQAGRSGEAERHVILRLLAAKQITMEDLRGVVEQYLNDADFIFALMKGNNIGDDNVRMVYDRYKDGAKGNPYLVAAIVSSIARSDQTPSDVLQKIATHKVEEIGKLYPRHVIESAQNTLLKREARPSTE